MWYLGMTGGVAALGALLALLNMEEEGACCLERRLSSLSTCFITFSVSLMRACMPTSCHSLQPGQLEANKAGRVDPVDTTPPSPWVSSTCLMQGFAALY